MSTTSVCKDIGIKKLEFGSIHILSMEKSMYFITFNLYLQIFRQRSCNSDRECPAIRR